jgi:L-iditol 2-dehydrogenase
MSTQLAELAVLPTTMRAAVMTDLRTIDIVESPVPSPGPGQALVRMKAVGICGSDVHYYVDGRIGDAVVRYPFQLGHEPAGVVAALGEGVTGLAVGTRVALEPSHSCGHCAACIGGRPNVCPTVRFLGTPPISGCYAEYHVFAAEQCVPIPDGVSMEAAATLEPMAVGLHAVNLARLRLGDRVAIMGGGPIGILTAVAARLAGASFIALTEPIADRRALAKRFDIDLILNPDACNAVEEINRVAGAIDVSFECAGQQAAIDDATLVVRPGGTTIIIGIPSVDTITLFPHLIRRKELNIIMARRANLALEPAIRLMAAGSIHPEHIITHHFSMEKLAEGMELVHSYTGGVLKAMVVM